MKNMRNSKEIISSSIPMLDEIINKLKTNSNEDLNILDLACGSGFNSNYIYTYLKTGNYTLVDLCPEILNSSKENLTFNFTFIESDILSYLNGCSNDSMDIIICTYGISSYPPKKIIKEFCRVLKNGGFLGVIDNLKGTFPEIKKIYSKLILKHYNLIENFIFKSNYSRNEYFFEKMFVYNRFNRLNLRSDSNILNFNNIDSLFNFLSSNDKLSPLNSLLNIEHSEVKSTVINFLETYNINTITAKYIWGAFRNDK